MIFEEKVKLINREISGSLEDSEYLYKKSANFMMSSSGKRYRALVGLETFEMLGGKTGKFLKIAAGIEYLHSSSLVFDDIMDKAPLRRGNPTIHKLFGENTAILSGLELLNGGNEMLRKGALENLRIPKNLDELQSYIYRTIEGLIIGQNLDLKEEKTEEDLLRLTYEKNRIFNFACVAPVLLIREGISEDDYLRCKSVMEKVGVDLSEGYQLLDDLKDTDNSPVSDGKLTGMDSGKQTTLTRFGKRKVKEIIKKKKASIVKNLSTIGPSSNLEKLIGKILHFR